MCQAEQLLGGGGGKSGLTPAQGLSPLPQGEGAAGATRQVLCGRCAVRLTVHPAPKRPLLSPGGEQIRVKPSAGWFSKSHLQSTPGPPLPVRQTHVVTRETPHALTPSLGTGQDSDLTTRRSPRSEAPPAQLLAAGGAGRRLPAELPLPGAEVASSAGHLPDDPQLLCEVGGTGLSWQV